MCFLHACEPWDCSQRTAVTWSLHQLVHYGDLEADGITCFCCLCPSPPSTAHHSCLTLLEFDLCPNLKGINSFYLNASGCFINHLRTYFHWSWCSQPSWYLMAAEFESNCVFDIWLRKGWAVLSKVQAREGKEKWDWMGSALSGVVDVTPISSVSLDFLC